MEVEFCVGWWTIVVCWIWIGRHRSGYLEVSGLYALKREDYMSVQEWETQTSLC